MADFPSNTLDLNTPMIVALFFGLAGAFFLGIYFIHRIRRQKALRKLRLRAEASRAASVPSFKAAS